MSARNDEKIGALEKEMVGVNSEVRHLRELHTTARKDCARIHHEVKEEMEKFDKKLDTMEKNLKDELNNGVRDTIKKAIQESMPTTVSKGFGPNEWTAIIITFITAAGAIVVSVFGG